MQYTEIFFQLKKLKMSLENINLFSYFCPKRRLKVHVFCLYIFLLAEADLTSTHNLCFGPKISKQNNPRYLPMSRKKDGMLICVNIRRFKDQLSLLRSTRGIFRLLQVFFFSSKQLNAMSYLQHLSGFLPSFVKTNKGTIF